MPVGDQILITEGVPTRIVEVNPNRETLTIINTSSYFLVLADDDQPVIVGARIHGIPIAANGTVTLERRDGDRPDKSWWIYSFQGQASVVIFQGMTSPKRRWW